MKTIIKNGKVVDKLNVFDKIDNRLEGNKVYDFYYDHIWRPIWKIFYFYPKEFIHSTRMFFQRGRLGYTHEDYWALNYYLAKYLAGVLKDWSENNNSYPPEIAGVKMSEKEWEYFLKDSAESFQIWLDIEENDPWHRDPETKERYEICRKKIRRFFLIASEAFETLWD